MVARSLRRCGRGPVLFGGSKGAEWQALELHRLPQEFDPVQFGALRWQEVKRCQRLRGRDGGVVQNHHPGLLEPFDQRQEEAERPEAIHAPPSPARTLRQPTARSLPKSLACNAITPTRGIVTPLAVSNQPSVYRQEICHDLVIGASWNLRWLDGLLIRASGLYPSGADCCLIHCNEFVCPALCSRGASSQR